MRAGRLAATAIALFAVFSAPASAGIIHPYIGSVDTPGGTFNAVDNAGNFYVYGNGAVRKYGPSGNPVDFSALGTNLIDGQGGPDAVPSGGLYGTTLAVDNSTSPASGYIYVSNPSPGNPNLPQPGQTEVFDSSGTYVGEIDESAGYPASTLGGGSIGNIVVDQFGHIFAHYEFFGAQVDEYTPLDANPAHNRFLGQLRNDQYRSFYGTSGATATYLLNDNDGGWVKYPAGEFQRPSGESVPAQPDPFFPDSYGMGIEPPDENVYLFGGSPFFGGDSIAEYSSSGKRLGPPFGVGKVANGARHMGVANPNGLSAGNLYFPGSANGGESVAIFGPPIVVPDAIPGPAVPGHYSTTVTASVERAGGPEVTECRVEWGSSDSYGESVACNEGLPFTAASTPASADIAGLSPETTYHYRFVVTNSNGTNFSDDATFHTVAVLGLTTDAPTNVQPGGATLNGSLNPDGEPATYHFEYGLTSDYGHSTPDQSVGGGSVETPVTGAAISGLQSGRVYHFRIVAGNGLGTTTGGDRSFVTAHAPSISGVNTTNVSASSADLHARINPFGSTTHYRFEYGTTTAYGSSVPVPEGELTGGSIGSQAVDAHLEDLRSVTYHFRVVATNQWGTTFGDDTTISFLPPECPNANVRQQTGSNYLPDCRGYELVSPGEAGAIQLFPGAEVVDIGRGFFIGNPEFAYEVQNRGFAMSPSRFQFFGGIGRIAGLDAPNSLMDPYVSTRTEGGWVTTYAGLPASQYGGDARNQCDATLSKCLDHLPISFTTGGGGENAPYLWDVSGKSLGRLPTNLAAIPGGEHFVGDQRASLDFSHYVFSSRNLAFAPGALTSAPGSAYDNDIAEESVSLISSQPDGSPIPSEPSNSGDLTEYLRFPALSHDGSHILMSSSSAPVCKQKPSVCPPLPPSHLYMRVDDSVTYDVSVGHDVRFVAMTSDGSQVYLTSTEGLTPADTDSSVDLYRWTEEGDALELVSAGAGAGSTDGCAASWTSQCDIQTIKTTRPDIDQVIAPGSGDIYFFSPEQLISGKPGIDDEPNLYLLRNGQLSFVATFEPGRAITRSDIAPEGNAFAFVTSSNLTGYDSAGLAEMYLFTPSTQSLKCVSCLPDGSPPTSSVEASGAGPFMSDDGRAFFATKDRLVPQDTDGAIIDVYEYVDGRPQLISSGTGVQDRYTGIAWYAPHSIGLEAVSANGADVYFSTFDTLVAQDHNGQFLKFYDARTGGGFQVNLSVAPCEAADECHGVSSSAPGAAPIGTDGKLGSGGNLHTRRRHAHKKKHRHKKRHGRRGSHGGGPNHG